MKLLRSSEVAKRLNKSASAVRQLCIAGKVPGAYQDDRNIWNIPEDSLSKILEDTSKPRGLWGRVDKLKEVSKQYEITNNDFSEGFIQGLEIAYKIMRGEDFQRHIPTHRMLGVGRNRSRNW